MHAHVWDNEGLGILCALAAAKYGFIMVNHQSRLTQPYIFGAETHLGEELVVPSATIARALSSTFFPSTALRKGTRRF